MARKGKKTKGAKTAGHGDLGSSTERMFVRRERKPEPTHCKVCGRGRTLHRFSKMPGTVFNGVEQVECSPPT